MKDRATTERWLPLGREGGDQGCEGVGMKDWMKAGGEDVRRQVGGASSYIFMTT